MILPIYYLHSDEIEDSQNNDEIGVSLRARQYLDWRDIRFYEADNIEVAKRIAAQADMIKSRVKSLEKIFASEKDIDSYSEDYSVKRMLVNAGPKSLSLNESFFESLLRGIEGSPKKAIETTAQPAPTEEYPHSSAGPYKIYTAEYDEIIDASSFISVSDAVNLTKALTATAAELSNKNKKSIDTFIRDFGKSSSKETYALSFLLDNSGSMRGKSISLLSAWSLTLAEIFERLGCEVEVTGFTTRAWKGGQSREKWLADGRPPLPGRLNDIRYIQYKKFSQSFVVSLQNFSVMWKEGILKENIDGEAIQFALDTIKHVKSDNKIIVVLSDGAPVDDSTLSVNGGSYLENHLKFVIEENKNTTVKLLAVGVDYDATRYYGDIGIKSTPEKIGIDLFRLIRRKILK